MRRGWYPETRAPPKSTRRGRRLPLDGPGGTLARLPRALCRR
jgi:hypothetical protein